MKRLLDINLKGLPQIEAVNVYPRPGSEDPVLVSVTLATPTRRTVALWAKRLGVPVSERSMGGSLSCWRRLSAKRVQDGVRLVVSGLVFQESDDAPAPSDGAS